MNTISDLKKHLIHVLLILLLLTPFTTIYADIYKRNPQPDKLVYDHADIINSATEKKLENKFSSLYKNEGIKFAIFTKNFRSGKGLKANKNAIPESIFSNLALYKVDTSVLLVISPHEEFAYIKVGSAYSDKNIKSLHKIVKKTINPALKHKSYHHAVNEGTQKIINEIPNLPDIQAEGAIISFLKSISTNKFVMFGAGICLLYYLMSNGLISFTSPRRRGDDDYYDDYYDDDDDDDYD